MAFLQHQRLQSLSLDGSQVLVLDPCDPLQKGNQLELVDFDVELSVAGAAVLLLGAVLVPELFAGAAEA